MDSTQCTKWTPNDEKNVQQLYSSSALRQSLTPSHTDVEEIQNPDEHLYSFAEQVRFDVMWGWDVVMDDASDEKNDRQIQTCVEQRWLTCSDRNVCVCVCVCNYATHMKNAQAQHFFSPKYKHCRRLCSDSWQHANKPKSSQSSQTVKTQAHDDLNHPPTSRSPTSPVMWHLTSSTQHTAGWNAIYQIITVYSQIKCMCWTFSIPKGYRTIMEHYNGNIPHS